VKKKHYCQQSAYFAINAPSKVRNCAVPPAHLRSEISYRALATFQNIGKRRYFNQKGQKTLFQSNMYFVRILTKFYTYSNNSESL